MMQKVQERRQERASNCEHTYRQKQKYGNPPGPYIFYLDPHSYPKVLIY